MSLQRIEQNFMTGERKVIDLTPDEESAAWARTAEEKAKPVVKQETVADLKAALIKKSVISQADLDT